MGGNAYQAAQFYRTVLGFDIVGYRGRETGRRDHASYALRQGAIRRAVTAPLSPDSPIAHHVAWHGDGVRAIAFRVSDADATVRSCRVRGARPAMYERRVEDEHGAMRLGAVYAYGDTVHTFVEYDGYDGPFLPGYREVPDLPGRPLGLKAIDHAVANVELGQMETWARFYRDVLGFTQLLHFTDEQIGTEYSALMSKVMQGARGRVKLPINEPAPGKRKSQIQEFLDFYGGPGVQHIALITGDILGTVYELRARGNL